LPALSYANAVEFFASTMYIVPDGATAIDEIREKLYSGRPFFCPIVRLGSSTPPAA
jgi:hypothetical protein